MRSGNDHYRIGDWFAWQFGIGAAAGLNEGRQVLGEQVLAGPGPGCVLGEGIVDDADYRTTANRHTDHRRYVLIQIFYNRIRL